MYNFDLEKVNRSLVKCLKLVMAVRRMLGPRSDVCNEVDSLDLEIREAGAECQRVLELAKADADRPLITD